MLRFGLSEPDLPAQAGAIRKATAVAKVAAAKILVIDDNAAVVDVLVTCLHQEGYKVSGALTGEEGLKSFILSRPDLVLLDVALAGGMDGVEVLKRIRLINPAAKVVMVTGNSDATLARDTLERGALAYVDKPFDFAYLKRVVAMAFQTERAQPNEHSTG